MSRRAHIDIPEVDRTGLDFYHPVIAGIGNEDIAHDIYCELERERQSGAHRCLSTATGRNLQQPASCGAAGIRDKDIARSIHSHTNGVTQAADQRALATAGATAHRNLH